MPLTKSQIQSVASLRRSVSMLDALIGAAEALGLQKIADNLKDIRHDIHQNVNTIETEHE
jgi:hypothetical protein